MKKTGILNSEITKVLADLGHTDLICISDAGLPVPEGVKKIDISLKRDLPSFLDTLEIILSDMWVENVYLANEIQKFNPNVLTGINHLMNYPRVEYISHEDFKILTKSCKVIIRTGEMTPYSNIILSSNVHFVD